MSRGSLSLSPSDLFSQQSNTEPRLTPCCRHLSTVHRWGSALSASGHSGSRRRRRQSRTKRTARRPSARAKLSLHARRPSRARASRGAASTAGRSPASRMARRAGLNRCRLSQQRRALPWPG
eukprot:1574075-Pleurochrysis_carterae.AAC.2